MTPQEELAVAQRKYFDSIKHKFDDDICNIQFTNYEIWTLYALAKEHIDTSGYDKTKFPVVDKVCEYLTIQPL